MMSLSRLRLRWAIGLGCPLLVALIGYGDYREGYENSMLLLYLAPIAIATWYNGITLGIFMAALCVGADLVSDSMAGLPRVGIWNVASSFLYFIVFAVLLSRWHNLLNEMHRRVEERTADLQREIVARKALEQKIAEVLEANGLVSHPEVSVSVKERKSKPITVVGAVPHPMVYQADRPVTLLEVLAEAVEWLFDIHDKDHDP